MLLFEAEVQKFSPRNLLFQMHFIKLLVHSWL